ncbi:MAG: hypothetical protein HY273_03755 [Gammaproteobacteria bacterium]|nr:hypothetical protein [Gammaproteobacteria bacterium]
MKHPIAWIAVIGFLAVSVGSNAATPPTAKAEANVLCEKTWKNSTHEDDKGIKDFLAKSCNKNTKSKKYWECVAKSVAQGNSVAFSSTDNQCPMK